MARGLTRERKGEGTSRRGTAWAEEPNIIEFDLLDGPREKARAWLEERERWEMIEELEVSGSRAHWELCRGLANCHLTHSQIPFGATSRKLQVFPLTNLQVIFSNHNFNFVSFRLHLLLFRTKSVQVWYREGRCG